MPNDDRPQDAAHLADQAAEAIRALIHATLTPDDARGFTYPGDAYSTVGNLAILAQRLPQAFEQIQTFIDRLNTRGNLRSDKGPDDLPPRLDDLRATLTAAVNHAHGLADSLDMAHQALGPIAYQDTQD